MRFLTSRPARKARLKLTQRGKRPCCALELKKKMAKSSKMASIRAVPILALGEGTSVNPGDVVGPNSSMLENSTMVKKLLEGVIPPFEK